MDRSQLGGAANDKCIIPAVVYVFKLLRSVTKVGHIAKNRCRTGVWVRDCKALGANIGHNIYFQG